MEGVETREFRSKGSSSLGEGLEEWVKLKGKDLSSLRLQVVLFLFLPDPGCGVPLAACRGSHHSRSWLRETRRGLL